MGVSRRLLFFLSDSQTNINRIERMANRPYKKKINSGKPIVLTLFLDLVLGCITQNSS